MTGSLKHRLARSLFLHALVNGHIHEGTTVVEASSGSTAISEAYFARLLGLPFVAVMPATTSADKIALIEAQGGRCHLVDDGATVYAVAQQLAEERRRPLHGPVHQRRAGHRLARQQQHRRDHLRADEPGGPPDPALDRRRRRHRRHRVDHRPLHPLSRLRHAAVRGGSGAFGHLRLLPHRRCHPEAGSRVWRRGDRPAAGRTARSSARSSTR